MATATQDHDRHDDHDDHDDHEQEPTQIQPTDRPLLEYRTDTRDQRNLRGTHEHTRIVTLEYLHDRELGYLARLVTAAFHGKHYGAEYHPGAYRYGIHLQVFYAHAGPQEIMLGWDAAKRLAAAIAAWEQEHPDLAPLPIDRDDDQPF